MISYGDVPLVQPTSELAAWLAMFLPPSEAFSFYRWRKLSDSKFNPRPHLDWFLSRPVRVNTFFNPWGASRWGMAFVLADETMLATIRQRAYNAQAGGYAPLPLVIDDGTLGVVVTDLWLRPAIPLSKFDERLNLYLLPLVDDRFFWWEKSAEITVTEGTTAWSDVYDEIADALGITLTAEDVSDAYLFPSECLSSQYEYLPLLLDLVAESVGHRIVRTLGGNYHARSATTAISLSMSQAATYRKYAGGELDLEADVRANVPVSVSVSFPWVGSSARNVYEITLASLGLTEYAALAGHADGQHIIHSTCLASFDEEPATNETELTTLAESLATDFYLWRLAWINTVYEKAVPWVADGMHDVEWRHGDHIATFVHRSMWEPEHGKLYHAGEVGAEACDGAVETFLGVAVGTITGRTVTSTAVATLTSGVTDSSTVLSLSSTALLPDGILATVTIDSEEIVIKRSGVTVNIVCRGANGSTVADHSSAASVVRKRVTFGSGTVAKQRAVFQTGDEWDMTDTCELWDVLNPCPAIADDAIVQAYREPESGKYLVREECGGSFADGGGGSDCECDETSYCVTFTGITDSACTNCNESADIQITMGITSGCQYYYNSASCVSDCFALCGFNYTVVEFLQTGDNEWTLTVRDNFGDLVAKYTADTSTWNCTDDLVMDRILPTDSGPDERNYCQNWPATVTVTQCGGDEEPTVDLSEDDLCDTALSVIITGTGFSVTPGDNTVVFNLGASGTVTAATPTELTVTFSVSPTTTGALTAIVTTPVDDSGAAVQIATVITCESGWEDTFTDSDAVALEDHTPDIGDEYTQTSGTMEISGNELIATHVGVSTYYFDPGLATSVLTVEFVLSADSEHFFVNTRGPATGIVVAVSPISGTSWELIITDGINMVSVGVTLNNATTYTLEVSNSENYVGASVNGVGTSLLTNVDYGGTGWAISISQSSAGATTVDNLNVVSAPAPGGPIDIDNLGSETTSQTPVSSFLKNITVSEAGLLVVSVVTRQSTDAVGTTVTAAYASNPMTLDATSVGSVSGSTDSIITQVFSLPVSISGGDVVISKDGGTPNAIMEMTAVLIKNLVDNAVDQIATGDGASAIPDTGATGTTSTADEAVICVMGIAKTGLPPPAAWQNGFTSGGQDVVDSGVESIYLYEGRQIASGTGTFQGELSNSVTVFAGVTVTYS